MVMNAEHSAAGKGGRAARTRAVGTECITLTQQEGKMAVSSLPQALPPVTQGDHIPVHWQRCSTCCSFIPRIAAWFPVVPPEALLKTLGLSTLKAMFSPSPAGVQ